MHELISIISPSVSDIGTCSNNNKVSGVFTNMGTVDDSQSSGPLLSSTNPGLFTLTPEQLESWISHKPLSEFYVVDDEPFARGKFATVRRVTERSTGRQLAAKCLRKRRRSSDLTPEIIHEVAVLLAMRDVCQNIVRLEKVFETNNEIILILELAPGGELQTVLDSEEGMDENHVIRFMKQILQGLAHLHALNIAHLDLKPQNLVLTSEFPNCDVKLCDFGISRYIAEGADVRELLGTPDYVAPEVLNYEPISIATDMWSVGVLAYVLLTGYSPFGGDTKQETFCNITQCKLDFPPELFEDVSEKAKDFISKLLVKKSSQRLTVRESLSHPWLEDTTSQSTNIQPPTVPSANANVESPVPVKEIITEKKDLLDNNTSPPVVLTDVNSNIVPEKIEKPPTPSDQPKTVIHRQSVTRRYSKTELCYPRYYPIHFETAVTSTPNTNSHYSSSSTDTASDMSVDSSSDRSSIVSIEDNDVSGNTYFLPSKRRLQSDTSSLASSSDWSVGSSVTGGTLRRRGSLDFLDRPFPLSSMSQSSSMYRLDRVECSNSFVSAYEKFSALTVKDDSRSSAKETLRLYTGRSRVISNFRLSPDMVVIREFAQRKGSLTKQAEVQCESVRSRRKKFEMQI